MKKISADQQKELFGFSWQWRFCPDEKFLPRIPRRGEYEKEDKDLLLSHATDIIYEFQRVTEETPLNRNAIECIVKDSSFTYTEKVSNIVRLYNYHKGIKEVARVSDVYFFNDPKRWGRTFSDIYAQLNPNGEPLLNVRLIELSSALDKYIDDPIERAFVLFLTFSMKSYWEYHICDLNWVYKYNHLWFGYLIMNGYLISNGYLPITFNEMPRNEFNQRLGLLFGSLDAHPLMELCISHMCPVGYVGNLLSHQKES